MWLNIPRTRLSHSSVHRYLKILWFFYSTQRLSECLTSSLFEFKSEDLSVLNSPILEVSLHLPIFRLSDSIHKRLPQVVKYSRDPVLFLSVCQPISLS